MRLELANLVIMRSRAKQLGYKLVYSERKISHLAAPVKIAHMKVEQIWNWRDVCGENDA